MTLPGELFARLWSEVEPHSGAVISTPWHGRHASEHDVIADLLRGWNTPEIPPDIDSYLSGKPISFKCDVEAEAKAERAFVVMCALDEAVMDIHPALKTRVAGRSLVVGNMLSNMRAERSVEGHYAYVPGVGYVIPKGQLTSRRRVNEIDDASGSDLATQFEYLALVKPIGAGRSIEFTVVPPSRCKLVDPNAVAVGVAPIAEDADDLVFNTVSRLERPFLDTQPANPTVLSERLITAVDQLLSSGADMIVLPELVVSPDAVKNLASRLRARGAASRDGLIVCGSGLSQDRCAETNKPFNECTVMTTTGEIIFSQRKLHPFNMAAKRMKDCQINAAVGHDGKSHMEDIAAGSVLKIYDLHDIGRVIVLICEDLEQVTPCGDICIAVRPDWIFTPVLDISQEPGRWTHRRAVEIARRTLSRVVVSSSACLTVRLERKSKLTELEPAKVGISLLCDGYAGNKVKRIQASGTSPEGFVISWDTSTWPNDHISIVSV